VSSVNKPYPQIHDDAVVCYISRGVAREPYICQERHHAESSMSLAVYRSRAVFVEVRVQVRVHSHGVHSSSTRTVR
jgi:hypothetical protein